MFIITFLEKIFYTIYKQYTKRKNWNNLTNEEIDFIKHYITKETKTQYVSAYNGTWRNSGIINPLIKKNILYLASKESEFRGNSWMDASHHFPFNIHDDAYKYFMKNLR